MSSRLSAFIGLLLISILPGCVTTQADLSKGLDPTKAYVIAGREATAKNWLQYIEANEATGGSTIAAQMRGLISGREWVFRRYENNKVLSKAYPGRSTENTFIVNVSLNPFVYSKSFASIVTNPERLPDISLVAEPEQISSATVSQNGYLVYDVFEVEPGDWVLERLIYTPMACQSTSRCPGTVNNLMLLERGKIEARSLGFSVARGEAVYIGDARTEFDVVESAVIRTDRDGTKSAAGFGTYSQQIFVAKNLKHFFKGDEARMREMLARRLDVSKVVTRELGEIR